ARAVQTRRGVLRGARLRLRRRRLPCRVRAEPSTRAALQHRAGGAPPGQHAGGAELVRVVPAREEGPKPEDQVAGGAVHRLLPARPASRTSRWSGGRAARAEARRTAAAIRSGTSGTAAREPWCSVPRATAAADRWEGCVARAASAPAPSRG